jgi:hypothetical protein
MAIAICTYCGGLVLIRATMCPHCGQRGEAMPSRRKVSTFGAKKGLPRVVRRAIILGIAGAGALVCLAFANWIRPDALPAVEELKAECDEIRQNGVEEANELNACEAKLVKVRAAQR